MNQCISRHGINLIIPEHSGFSSKGITHWGRVTHICVSKLTIIGSDNGLAPGRRQTIIWTNAGILLIGALGTNFSEILIEIHTFSSKRMQLEMSSAKCRAFCFGLKVLIYNEVWTKWSTFYRRHFQIHFRERKLLYFISIYGTGT